MSLVPAELQLAIGAGRGQHVRAGGLGVGQLLGHEQIRDALVAPPQGIAAAFQAQLPVQGRRAGGGDQTLENRRRQGIVEMGDVFGAQGMTSVMTGHLELKRMRDGCGHGVAFRVQNLQEMPYPYRFGPGQTIVVQQIPHA